MRNKKLFKGFVVAVILLLSVETYIYFKSSNPEKKETRIAFVVTGDNLDNWENMKAGAETAAMDENCFVDFIYSPLEYGASGELENIERQILEGADYVVVATSDFQVMRDNLKLKNLTGKVIFVKNGIYQSDKKSIIPDDYQLGVDFGTYILETSKATKLLMVTTLEDVNNLTVMTGIQEVLKDSPIKVEYRLMSATSGTLNQSMYNLGQSEFFDGFITIDNATLEAAAKAQNKLKNPVEIYSVDNSRQAVYYLDSNVINALAFKDDYSMGYLVVKEILSGKRPVEAEDGLYYISDKETIHSDKMEKVLFPFVK